MSLSELRTQYKELYKWEKLESPIYAEILEQSEALRRNGLLEADSDGENSILAYFEDRIERFKLNAEYSFDGIHIIGHTDEEMGARETTLAMKQALEYMGQLMKESDGDNPSIPVDFYNRIFLLWISSTYAYYELVRGYVPRDAACGRKHAVNYMNFLIGDFRRGMDEIMGQGYETIVAAIVDAPGLEEDALKVAKLVIGQYFLYEQTYGIQNGMYRSIVHYSNLMNNIAMGTEKFMGSGEEVVDAFVNEAKAGNPYAIGRLGLIFRNGDYGVCVDESQYLDNAELAMDRDINIAFAIAGEGSMEERSNTKRVKQMKAQAKEYVNSLYEEIHEKYFDEVSQWGDRAANIGQE